MGDRTFPDCDCAYENDFGDERPRDDPSLHRNYTHTLVPIAERRVRVRTNDKTNEKELLFYSKSVWWKTNAVTFAVTFLHARPLRVGTAVDEPACSRRHVSGNVVSTMTADDNLVSVKHGGVELTATSGEAGKNSRTQKTAWVCALVDVLFLSAVCTCLHKLNSVYPRLESACVSTLDPCIVSNYTLLKNGVNLQYTTTRCTRLSIRATSTCWRCTPRGTPRPTACSASGFAAYCVSDKTDSLWHNFVSDNRRWYEVVHPLQYTH